MGCYFCSMLWLCIIGGCLMAAMLPMAIIGSVNLPKDQRIERNAKPATCTYQGFSFNIRRCTSFGLCYAIVWNVTYPRPPSNVTQQAFIEDRYSGYANTIKKLDSRQVGNSYSCYYDTTQFNQAWWDLPSSKWLVWTVVCWLFFFIGFIPFLILIFQCAGCKPKRFFSDCFRCRCFRGCCTSSSSSSTYNYNNNNATPLYSLSSPTYQPTRSNRSASFSTNSTTAAVPPVVAAPAAVAASISRSSSSGSISISRSISTSRSVDTDPEKNPIPPVPMDNTGDYDGAGAGYNYNPYTEETSNLEPKMLN